MVTPVSMGGGLDTQIADLSAKVASVDAMAFETAGDQQGYGTTQQIVLDNLVSAYQKGDQSAFNYWSNICSSIYQALPFSERAKWDNAGYNPAASPPTPPAPFFGNTGILGYWAETATAAATGVKSALVGETPSSPDKPTVPWFWIVAILAIVLFVFVL
jgi:hypothetical protein